MTYIDLSIRERPYAGSQVEFNWWESTNADEVPDTIEYVVEAIAWDEHEGEGRVRPIVRPPSTEWGNAP